ncbi:vascular endothelial growth factor receptor 1 isoform X2 [Diachasma alloeum]|uniref:vascular endothelial growth factor receptor 1 isoform X2 n=1 Tax=Diachasma alloeum TaxID=454923 RepID=UPI00073839AE|nr:vascular endothelial growth factor receptor 1 isoform X2 [Diachasma alloeum]
MNSVLKSLPIFLVLSQCTGIIEVFNAKPEIEPNVEELQIDEGQPLNITCTSNSQEIEFYYPVESNEITTSAVDINSWEIDGKHYATLRKPETIYGDTGYYGCADVGVFVDQNVHDQPNVRWIYVYVRSTANLFVSSPDVEAIHSKSGVSVIIPCRPTSPDYHVILEKNTDEELEIGEKISFDPRVGFTLHHAAIPDSGWYVCKIKVDNDEPAGLTYILEVNNVPDLVPPLIDESALRHVTLGQTLRVNCSIEMRSTDISYSLNWTIPNHSSRFKIKSYVENLSASMVRTISELQIADIHNEDAGVYSCTLLTHHGTPSTNTTLKIHDPNYKFIKLTPQKEDTHYVLPEGREITWVVKVDAYPPPILTWTFIDANREYEVNTSSRHKIMTSSDSTILMIKDLKISDMGHYVLRAVNSDEHSYITNVTLNFSLEVTSRPYVDEFPIQVYYLPNTWMNTTCHAAAYPAPKIFWSFVAFNTMTEIRPNATETSKFTETFSTVRLWTNASGYLNCSACNDHGCDSVVQRISVSEVEHGFGIISPEQEKVTIGDDVVLKCVAPIHNYTDDVKWLYENETDVTKSDRISLDQTQSEYTHQAILRINSVVKADDQNYICQATMLPDVRVDESYHLRIYDPYIPRLLNETNLNKSENIYSAGIDTLEAIVLNCFAGGMPKPTITWLKDDVPIDLSDPSSEAAQDYTLINKNQSLHIEHLLERVSGTYTCKAENKMGEVSSWQKITIKSKEVSKGLIILIIFLIVLVVVLVVFFSIKVHREKVIRKQLMEAGLTHFEEGALECLNSELTVDDQAELLPYDKKWEFPRERLKFGKQLGHGAFGVVMKAEAQGIVEEEDVTTVAVKMVKRSTESIHIRALASELKIMVHLGKHLNVVNLLGACTKNIAKRELLVIVEYCRYGNLHNYLLRHRSDFVNQIDPATGKIDVSIGSDLLNRTLSVGSNNSLSLNSNGDSGPYSPGPDSQGVSMTPDGMVLSNNSIQPAWRSNYRGDYKDSNLKPICTQDLLSWAFQVARGMEYLSQRKVLHGDLAARNILLAEDNVVKICDFGLAKTMYKDDNYKKKGDAPLPIKWMAIESIRDRIFSTQSDIWSFGIVLWEFFTLAKTPYPGMEAEKQYTRLIEGYRMEKPEFATDDVYDIMFQCWKAKPTLRPTFTELAESIGNLLDDSVKMHYVDLNTPYMDMNLLIKHDYLKMMSAPDHETLSSPAHYVNTPCLPQTSTADDPYLCMTPSVHKNDTDDIFSPRVPGQRTHFEFPTPQKHQVHSDSDSEGVEFSPMLPNSEDDNYLQPINVAERRAEFARQRQAMKKTNSVPVKENIERDSGYCNTPHNLKTFDLNGDEIKDEIDGRPGNDKGKSECNPGIIKTQDNYVNMPRNKNDLRRDSPDSFTNPSYVLLNIEPEPRISSV